jgi:hypothetical protein
MVRVVRVRIFRVRIAGVGVRFRVSRVELGLRLGLGSTLG